MNNDFASANTRGGEDGVSDEPARLLETEEQLLRLLAARRNGGVCAACDKRLVDDEIVWFELVVMRVRPRSKYWAPLGEECVSPAFLAATKGKVPGRCAGCGRGVYYARKGYRGNERTQSLCSRRCRYRASVARRSAQSGDGS
jgi:hypothetical protein